MRASQINGCGYCLDMHSKDARAAGETEQRLYLLPAWREADCYAERERAALAWCEALTRLDGHDSVSDTLYVEASAHFDERELVHLTPAGDGHQQLEPDQPGRPHAHRTLQTRRTLSCAKWYRATSARAANAAHEKAAGPCGPRGFTAQTT